MMFNDAILPILLLVQYFVESMHAFMCMFMHIGNKCVHVEARCLVQVLSLGTSTSIFETS